MSNKLSTYIDDLNRNIHSKEGIGSRIYVPSNYEGCVLFLPMDRKAYGLSIDQSGFNNHSTVYGAVEIDAQINKGLYFDGIDDYVDCGNVINVTNKLTVVAWANPSTGVLGNIVGKFQSNDKRWHICPYAAANQIYWNIGGANFATSPLNLLLNSLHHYAMVYDGELIGNENRLKAFIDGQQISLTFTGIIPSVMPSIVANLRIGQQQSQTYYFKGIIDEVKIYNRALSEQEISSMYQQES